jgi:hypothetical protein
LLCGSFCLLDQRAQPSAIDQLDVSAFGELARLVREASRSHYETTSCPFGCHHAVQLTYDFDAHSKRAPLFALNEAGLSI